MGYLSLEALREILNLKSIWQTVKTIFGGEKHAMQNPET
jgi:hypothetical protein